MTRFLFDTGVIVGYVRNASYAEYLDKKYRPLELPNYALISAVSKGEMLSLAIQFKWGEEKRQKLGDLLKLLPTVEIDRAAILERYAEIDTYSQSKNPARPLPPGASARKMGKNDVWIAATASVLDATLVTMDADFDHLHGVFLSVIKIDQKSSATTL